MRTREADLFFAVIVQAFNDMRGLGWVNSTICDSARQWLLYDEHDFNLICKWAMADRDEIRAIAVRYEQYLREGGTPKFINTDD
jgi:hypothetical protein